jgi:hypothetical protein
MRWVFSEFQAFVLLGCYSALVGSWLLEILWSSSVLVELVSNVDIILCSGNFKEKWETAFVNDTETPNVCVLNGCNTLPCQTSQRVVHWMIMWGGWTDYVILMVIVINTVSSKSWSIICKLHKLRMIYVAELCILFMIFMHIVLWNIFYGIHFSIATFVQELK